MIELERAIFAERVIWLDGRPFSIADYPLMSAIYNDPGVNIILKTGRQIGKTQCVDAPITMSDGSTKKAGDVVLNDSVLSLNTKTQKIVPKPVTWISPIYKKESVRITTRLGLSLDVATTHPIRTWDSWTTADELSLRDRVAVIRKGGIFHNEDTYPIEEVKILAYLLGDGCLTELKRIRFTKYGGPQRKEYTDCLDTLLIPWKAGRRGRDIISGKIPVINDNFTKGCNSYTKHIPNFVFRMSRKNTAIFINRLWATDGNVTWFPAKQNYHIEYSSNSRKMIKSLQALLWKFGVVTKIRSRLPRVFKDRGEYPKLNYNLRVETLPSVRIFLKEIGAFTKSENVPLPTKEANNNRDTYPMELNTLIKQACPSMSGKRRSAVAKGCSLYEKGLRRTFKYPLSKSKMERCIEYFHSVGNTDVANELQLHKDGDVYWDSIVSIEPLSVIDCVDFTVEEHHNFLIDGVVTHNSTTLCNFLGTEMMAIPQFKTLFVTPSKEQTSRFSNTRFAKMIFYSPFIAKYYLSNKMPSNNVLLRMLANGSEITFSYALDNADRIRGVSADRLCLDEVQNIVVSEVEPVLRECLAASQYKYRMYCGTPLTFENDIETIWQKSSKNEWVVSCIHCRTPQIITEKNMGDDFLMCLKCHKELDVRIGNWYAEDPTSRTTGYHISQLIVHRNVTTEKNVHTGMRPYDEIVDKRKDYSPSKFKNEVLGESDSIGTRLVSLGELEALCQTYYWEDGSHNKQDVWDNVTTTVAGVDWSGQGQSNASRTVLTVIGLLTNGKLRLMYGKIFPSGNPVNDVNKIGEMCDTYRCSIIIGDAGEGSLANATLRNKLGHHRVFSNRYGGSAGGGGGNLRIKWNGLDGYQSERTVMIDQVMMAFKTQIFEFPTLSQSQPFINDILAEYEESTPQGRRVWRHASSVPDDGLHALAFGWLAAKVVKGEVNMYENAKT